MSENILYKFAKDLSQLYTKIQTKSAEQCFLRVAQALESEVEKWLARAIQLDTKSSLSKPEVLDTLVLLAKLKKSYPGGIDSGELSKYFINDPKLRFFLPTIVAFREIANSSDLAILSPYRAILDSSAHMSMLVGESDVASVRSDLTQLDNSFRDDLNRKVNKPYDDNYAPTSRRTVPKKEKIALLLNYLTRRFTEEISLAFEESGQFDIVGLTEDSNVLRDPQNLIRTMFPDYPPQNISTHIRRANEIVKQISKHIDMSDYDYAYNYIKAQIMLLSGEISSKDYGNFMYQSKLNMPNMYVNQGGEDGEMANTDPFMVGASAWQTPQTLILLSIVLYILGSKI